MKYYRIPPLWVSKAWMFLGIAVFTGAVPILTGDVNTSAVTWWQPFYPWIILALGLLSTTVGIIKYVAHMERQEKDKTQ